MAEIRRILDNIDRSDLEKLISEEADNRINADAELQEQIDVNKADIATNKEHIALNSDNIKTNNELIVANTNNINELAARHNEDKELLLGYINRIGTYVSVGVDADGNEYPTSKSYIDSMDMSLRSDLVEYIGTIQNDLNSIDNDLNTKIDTNTETLQNNINDVSDRLNTVANSDDETLDQLSEIVSYIKNNKDLIDGITTSKTNVTDFNALSERVATAEGEIDTAQANITSLQESYNSIPSWSLEETKPSYTYNEVGADSAGTAASEISTHDSSETAHSDIREIIETLINRVEATAKVVELWTGITIPSTPEEVPSTLEELQAE